MICKEDPPGIYRFESLGKGVIAAFHTRVFDQSRRAEFLQGLGCFLKI